MKIRHKRGPLFASLFLLASIANAGESISGNVYPKIIPISTSFGDIGSSISDFNNARSSKDASQSNMVIYADIDEIDLDNTEDHLIASLRDAVRLKKQILMESSLWDTNKLNKVARTIFDIDQLPNADSAILLATWTSTGWSTTQRYDSIVPMLTGVADLVESREMMTVKEKLVEKAVGGTFKVSGLWDFANATYYVDWRVAGYSQRYRPQDNTWALWESSYTPGSCVIAWRGSISEQDWYDDVINWLTSRGYYRAHDVSYDLHSGQPVVGKAYHDRFENRRSVMSEEIAKAGCDEFRITGHSLGGGMTLYHAYRWSHLPTIVRQMENVVAFNPSRLGNQLATGRLLWLRSEGGGGVPVASFCRIGDPVKTAMANFSEYCTLNGAQVSWHINPVTKFRRNHSLDLWTQCQSASSC